jgi:intein/homing endonuclease
MRVLCGEDIEKYMDSAKSQYEDDYNRVYDDFIREVIKIITKKYANKVAYHISNCVNHSLSPQDSVRASSVYLTGLFYECLVYSDNSEVIKSINIENIFSNLTKLLKDYSPKVKIKATKTLTFFKKVKTADYK